MSLSSISASVLLQNLKRIEKREAHETAGQLVIATGRCEPNLKAGATT